MGFEVLVTPRQGDYGIDLFATQDSNKVGIQAKMYGGSVRKVNREMIMQLHGARCYFDCIGAVLATDGQILKDAQQVAEKLNIKILYFYPEVPAVDLNERQQASRKPAEIEIQPIDDPVSMPCDIRSQIDHIWQQHVMPLQGQVLRRADGKENTIIKVDWTGIVRISSNHKTSLLPIEIFRLAIGQILSQGSITRLEINDQYPGRGSSGVFLILEQIPLFERMAAPLTLTFRK